MRRRGGGRRGRQTSRRCSVAAAGRRRCSPYVVVVEEGKSRNSSGTLPRFFGRDRAFHGLDFSLVAEAGPRSTFPSTVEVKATSRGRVRGAFRLESRGREKERKERSWSKKLAAVSLSPLWKTVDREPLLRDANPSTIRPSQARTAMQPRSPRREVSAREGGGL